MPSDQKWLVIPEPPAFEPGELITLDEVTKWLGAGETTIYRWMKEGTFPLSLMLGSKMRRWRRVDIEAWLASLNRNPPPASVNGQEHVDTLARSDVVADSPAATVFRGTTALDRKTADSEPVAEAAWHVADQPSPDGDLRKVNVRRPPLRRSFGTAIDGTLDARRFRGPEKRDKLFWISLEAKDQLRVLRRLRGKPLNHLIEEAVVVALEDGLTNCPPERSSRKFAQSLLSEVACQGIVMLAENYACSQSAIGAKLVEQLWSALPESDRALRSLTAASLPASE
jgi:prophage regulatory protein